MNHEAPPEAHPGSGRIARPAWFRRPQQFVAARDHRAASPRPPPPQAQLGARSRRDTPPGDDGVGRSRPTAMMDYQHGPPSRPAAPPAAVRRVPAGYDYGHYGGRHDSTTRNDEMGLHARAPHAPHQIHHRQQLQQRRWQAGPAATAPPAPAEARRRRARTLVLASLAAFAGLLVLDVLTHFSDLPERTGRAIKEGEAGARRLVDGTGLDGADGGPSGLLRRLAGSLLEDEGESGNKSDPIATGEDAAGQRAELPSQEVRDFAHPGLSGGDQGAGGDKAGGDVRPAEVGTRVAVPFLGPDGAEAVYPGTVTSLKDGLWRVTFDDGDDRALDGKELADATALYERLKSDGEGSGEGLPADLPRPAPSDPDLALVGRRIASRFLVDGSEEVFLGTVSGHRDGNSALFPDAFDVRYDDGDLRFLTRREVESALGLYAEHEGRDLLDRSFGAPMPGSSGRPRGGLRSLPLLPRHAMEHRQRGELIASERPVPDHLTGRHDDGGYRDRRLRRRAYLHPHTGSERRMQEGKSAEYEVGALYQGYGTHYVDMWVGTPPQRQTVIIDTGSSVTAFPCTGCVGCGSRTDAVPHHLDEEFDLSSSSTYERTTCRRRDPSVPSDRGAPCPLGSCSPGGDACHLAVSYAEGSTWTAVEGSDVVYPGGPHGDALAGRGARDAEGIGAGMADVGDGEPFEWMDFRLQFGCQDKVTGLFKTQLEDGIMGMDNRPGAFWLQLNEHYRSRGFVVTDSADGERDGDPFDPTQFALCYDRQPLSLDLESGVGSGALTLGGSDPMLHLTGMAFAENVTPKIGWYTVRITAVFLRPGGGTLLGGGRGDDAKLVRVDASEAKLNGRKGPDTGVIIDSGTTDTYLPEAAQAAFDEAWRVALDDESASYNNDPVQMTAAQVSSLPTILVVLRGHASSSSSDSAGSAGSHPDISSAVGPGDVVVAVPPTHYMEESRRSPGTWTPRVYFSERSGAQSILGSNFMMGHEILFDAGGGRIGFSESHCDYNRLVEERQQQTVAGLSGVEGEVAKGAAQIGVAVEEGEEAAVAVDKEQEVTAGTGVVNNDLAASGWSRRAANDIAVGGPV